MKTLITHLNEKLQQNFVFKGNLKQSPYQPVDLGLSVKWCACNVGATKPEDPGLLFQWGRTDGYKYDDKNNKFLSEDNYVTTSGTEYKAGELLKSEDDAAHVNMKGSWRMPTKEEMDELLELQHKWIDLNGVKGYKFTSENGNSIFIPVTGYFYAFGSFDNGGSHGGIWTSSVNSSSATYAHSLDFEQGYCEPVESYQCKGLSVRGVCK